MEYFTCETEPFLVEDRFPHAMSQLVQSNTRFFYKQPQFSPQAQGCKDSISISVEKLLSRLLSRLLKDSNHKKFG